MSIRSSAAFFAGVVYRRVGNCSSYYQPRSVKLMAPEMLASSTLRYFSTNPENLNDSNSSDGVQSAVDEDVENKDVDEIDETAARVLHVDPSLKYSISEEVQKTISLQTASNREVQRYKIREKVKLLQRHPTDTASPPVQSKSHF